MATSGTWSNLGDWLYYCMMNVRNARVMVHSGDLGNRKEFLAQVASALSRFANVPIAMRRVGLNAIAVQSTLRERLVPLNCLSVAPHGSDAIRVAPAGTARGAMQVAALVIGISMTNPLQDNASVDFRYICQYNPNALQCMLPAMPRIEPVVPLVVPRAAPTNLVSDEEDAPDTISFSDEPAAGDEEDDDDDDANTSAFFTKCPICLEIPFPPWKTTTCGHLICTECHAGLVERTKCPTCRQTCSNTLVPQLLFAEVAKANAVKIRCRYDECRRKIPWDAARAHHDTCAHRHQECPMQALTANSPKCEWKGPLGSIGKHLIDAHGALEDTQPSFTLTEANINDIIVWTRRQALVSVVRRPESRYIYIKMASLVSRNIHLRLETSILDTYKGTCTMKVAPLTSSITSSIFLCRSTKTPFSTIVSWEDVDVKKRKEREEDDDAEMPALKEARMDDDVDE